MTTDTATTDQAEPEVQHVVDQSARRFLMTLNGFDEIAIAAHFGQKIAAMREEDAITTGRALAFVHKRRNRDQYPTDGDAHTAALNMPMQEVLDYFTPDAESDDTHGDPVEAAQALAADMAQWCVATGFAPSEWRTCTQDERNAIALAHNAAIARAGG